MAEPIFWEDVQIDVQSDALAAALPITALTKANPPLLTYTGTDPTSGAFALLTVSGMIELDQCVVRLANVDIDDNTAEVDAQDSTDFKTFIAAGSGLQLVTFGKSMKTVQTVQVSGGEATMRDYSVIHQARQRQKPGTPSPISFALGSILDPTDLAWLELNKAMRTGKPRAIRFTFPGGFIAAFYAWISAPKVLGGATGEVVTTPITMSPIGEIIYLPPAA